MSAEGQPHVERIEALLGHYVEQRLVHGVTVDAEELCCDEPQLLEPLQECIREYEQLDRVLASTRTLAPGRVLLHYRIVDKIGAGGMGEVYLAEDQKLGRQVALKVLPAPMAGDRELLERFRREARAVAALNHPNIVTLYSIEETEGIHLLTMELVAGTTLSAKIPSWGMPLDQLFDLAVPVADALATAHEHNIAHRDLKPDNVMVDDDGRVKMLDFGLAKLIREPAGEDTATLTATLTRAGHLLGTVPYMSPEQVVGKPADARSDIFSFGVMLYQMATGRRPFQGAASAELISSILRDAPSPIDELRIDLPRNLERIILRCLEKEPDRRYPSARQVRDELAALERQVASGEATAGVEIDVEAAVEAANRRRLRGLGRWRLAGVAVVLALAAGYFQLRSRDEIPGAMPVPSAAPATAAAPTRPSIAVLFFQNMTADPELDWLRSGITDMLVTDLAQSPEIEVLSTRRLYQILKRMDALEQPALSFDLIQGIGERADVDAVVRGSYARVGDDFRIDVTIEETADGAILDSNHVRGRLEESLFALVGELSASVRNHFEVERPAESPSIVQAVTTSSLEAWRFYTEAVSLSHQSKRKEAIALLEKAVEIDPEFALALVYLGTLHENLGHAAQAREYTGRAFELADRLPLDKRYRIEGDFYSTWATHDRGIEAYRRGLRLYPDHPKSWPWQGLLAWRYAYLEKYQDTLELLREPLAGEVAYPGYYALAANTHAALGYFETGYRILADFSDQHPDNGTVQLTLGSLLIEWGRLEEAAGRLDRAADLRSGDYSVAYARWRLQVRQGDWARADAEAAMMMGSSDPLGRWRGELSRARNLTYLGRTEEALIHFDEAVGALPGRDAFTALARCWKAELLLQRGETARALTEARLAQVEGRGEFPELKGQFLAALAEQRLGRPAATAEIEKSLRQKWQSRPNKVEERQLHHLAGLLALDQGDAKGAVEALTRAESLLPPRGIEIHWHVYPDHVPIWFALGMAELAAGNDQLALRWFEQAASASEHIEQPVPYVRSFYYLGRIHQRGGQTAEARRSFERFLHHWQGGDIDRERLAEVLGSLY